MFESQSALYFQSIIRDVFSVRQSLIKVPYLNVLLFESTYSCNSNTYTRQNTGSERVRSLGLKLD